MNQEKINNLKPQFNKEMQNKTTIFLKNNYKWLVAIVFPMVIIIPIVLASSHDLSKKTYELLIKKSQTGEGAGAYEAGDIVMIKPAGYQWSQGEKQNFYIVKMELDKNQVEEFVKPKEIDTGKKDKDGKTIMELEKRRKYQLNDIEGLFNGKTIDETKILSK